MPGASILTVTVNAGIASGIYSFTVSGTSSGISRTLDLMLNITDTGMNGLPVPWSNGDIGGTFTGTDTSYANGTFTVTGTSSSGPIVMESANAGDPHSARHANSFSKFFTFSPDRNHF
jgi:hypothetical protein